MSRRREQLAPSLFPFLAVLLCTMGALVLILMLVVGQAQATANEAIANKQEQQEDLTAQLTAMKNALTNQREKLQLELEKKRLTLQAFEEQIRQSMQELIQLERTLAAIDDQSAQSDQQLDQTNQQISQLEKQLAEAAEKIKSKLEKPTGDKPVFAIIPYDGPNGTHRRPVYLECVKDGIIVQPEGVRIGLADLRPPYGPGNPLDAVLRTVRSRYVPANGALTSTAYPLLVVRPSGVQTYAMARMAMAGWDDQFGYELVEEHLELVFPEGETGLRDEIEKSLAMARNRQAALVMAMPGKYRSYVESFDSDEYQPLSGGRSGASPLGSAGDTQRRSSELGSHATYAAGDSAGGLAGVRGGFNLVSGETVGSGLPANNRDEFAPDSQSSQSTGSNSRGDFLGSGHPESNIQLPGFAGEPSAGELASSQTHGMNLRNTNEGTSAGNSFDPLNTQDLDPNAVHSSDASTARSGAAQFAGSQNSRTNAGGATRSSNSQATEQEQSSTTGAGAQQMVRPGSVPIAVPASLAGNPATQVTSDSQGPTGLNFNLNRSAAEPVASKKGRNWAWSGKSGAGTAVVRAIKLRCFADRWIVLPDAKSGTIAEIIMLDEPPQVCAERLAGIVMDRVDRWGLALMGGYWKPELVVDVAAGGEERFEQLKRLLEGSGLEIQRSK